MGTQDRFPTLIVKLLDDSKAAAKVKNYEVALQAVNDALKTADKNNLTPSLVISLLDYRYAIHIRMVNLESALKDSKSMIRLDRKDARGYVRSGTVATLNGDKAAALKYFEHGLKNVPASDPNSTLLLMEIKKTRDQISADLVVSRPRDPMATLPIEIIEIILSYLGYRQHVQLLGVSRSWRKVLSAMPPLTDTLAFSNAKKPISPKMLLAALRRLKLPRDLRVTNLTQPAASILKDRLHSSQSFRSLESLEIADRFVQLDSSLLGQWNLRTIIIDVGSVVSIGWVFKVLESCPLLEIGHFRRVHGDCDSLTLCSKSLVELELSYTKDLVPHECVLDLPRISKLQLDGFVGLMMNASTPMDLQHLKQLQTLSFRRCAITNIILPPQIKHLKMESCQFFDEAISTGQPHSIDYPPLDNLETLHMLGSCGTISSRTPWPHFIMQAATKTKPGRLTSLSMTLSSVRPENIVQMIDIPWFLGVKSLRASGPYIKDEHSPAVLRSCPDLEALYISEAPITGVFLSDLVEAPESKLREITVEKCATVSRDIVPWAKQRGVAVEYIGYNEAPTGRRVREQH